MLMTSEAPYDRGLQPYTQLISNLDDVKCPICLDFPHNGVLLQCSSYEKGCRAFVCDTDHLHSNCLQRFKNANGWIVSNDETTPACPLCRGQVTGWIVVDKARTHLDAKKRCCEEHRCTFMGTYLELTTHALLQHPHSRPSKIDPARQLDWDNFQQSSEIIDVLTTIHSEVPRGVVLGDYVIEYGENETGDEFEEFTGDESSWWTSCILYQVFDNIRNSRNRRRARVGDGRRGSRSSNSDDGSVEYRLDESEEEFGRSSSAHPSSRRRRSRFYDN